MKIIAIDVDDVLVNFNKTVLNKVNDKFKSNYVLNEVIWNFENLGEKEYNYAHKIFDKYEVHSSLKLLPFAANFVRLCAAHLEVVFVTSVYPAAIPYRNELLKKHFGDINYSVVYTNRKDLVHTDFMIDDSVLHVKRSPSPHKILLKKPWNEGFEVDGYVADSLEDAYSYIMEVLGVGE